VQAGARVREVIDALRLHGLTLPTLASIDEQELGGFSQVGSHGTGVTIAPIDHYVTALTIVTPNNGTIVMTERSHGSMFHLTKVGLGCLGIVVELSINCIPAHNLVEHTFVLTRQQARERIHELLERHKHVRYMWIPYTDAVVCVTNSPENTLEKSPSKNLLSDHERLAPMRDLLLELTQNSANNYTLESIRDMNFASLRDELLAIEPLNAEHIKRCNQAEAEYWRRSSESIVVKPSDQLLQFECGGQVRGVY
jgi:L-galactono-1,4-lactone dehydrogenase